MIGYLLFMNFLPLLAQDQGAPSLLHSAPTHCGTMEVVANFEVQKNSAQLTLFSKTQNKFAIRLKEKPNNLAITQFANQKVRAKIEIIHLNSPRLATAKGIEMSLELPNATAGHQGDGFRILESKNCLKNP